MTSITTNHELAEICLQHNIPLIGVYSKNELPTKAKLGGYIVNLSDSHDSEGKPLGGTHWVAFFVGKQKDGKIKACYFDSFGVAPPKSVQALLKNYVRYPYNNMTIQNIDSSVCGWYCLDFLLFMSRNPQISSIDKRFTAYLDRYSYNVDYNRRLLDAFLREQGINNFRW